MQSPQQALKPHGLQSAFTPTVSFDLYSKSVKQVGQACITTKLPVRGNRRTTTCHLNPGTVSSMETWGFKSQPPYQTGVETDALEISPHNVPPPAAPSRCAVPPARPRKGRRPVRAPGAPSGGFLVWPGHEARAPFPSASTHATTRSGVQGPTALAGPAQDPRGTPALPRPRCSRFCSGP